MVLKDFPLQMQLDNFKKMDKEGKMNMQEEIFNKLNEVHGPVINTYGEVVEEQNLIIIHNIVEVRPSSPVYKECSGDCDNCDNNCNH